MTNDLTTLSGALLEMKDHLENNLSSMGVDATYSSTDGLIGLIDEITNIAPSVGGLELTTSITLEKNLLIVAEDDNVVLSATVNGDYDDTSQTNIDLKGYLQGATVTFKEGNNILGTAITNTNGIATYTINNITSGTHTYTAIFNGTGTDYNSATQTITFNVESYYINDRCTSNAGLSNYGESILFLDPNTNTQNSTNTLTYLSDEYLLSGTGNYFSGREIVPLRGIGNVKLRIKFKLQASSAFNQLLIICDENDPSTSSTHPYCARVRNDKKLQYFSFNSETTIYTHSAYFNSDWYYLETTKNGTDWTITLYDNNLNQLYTDTRTLSTMTGTPKWYFGLQTEKGTTYSVHIKEIKALAP